jgi:hypothetical protein
MHALGVCKWLASGKQSIKLTSHLLLPLSDGRSLCGGLLAAFAGLDDRHQGEPVVCASSAQPRPAQQRAA